MAITQDTTQPGGAVEQTTVETVETTGIPTREERMKRIQSVRGTTQTSEIVSEASPESKTSNVNRLEEERNRRIQLASRANLLGLTPAQLENPKEKPGFFRGFFSDEGFGTKSGQAASRIANKLGGFIGTRQIGEFAGETILEGVDLAKDTKALGGELIKSGFDINDPNVQAALDEAAKPTVDAQKSFKKGVGGTGKLASFFIPGGAATKGAGFLKNTSSILGSGALSGALFAGGGALEDDDTLGDFIKRTTGGAAGGALASGLLNLTGRALRGLKNSLAGVDDQTINIINPKLFEGKKAQQVAEYVGEQEVRADKLNKYINQAKKATENVKEDTPLALASKQFVEAKNIVDDLVSDAGKSVGEAKKALGTSAKLSDDVLDGVIKQFNNDAADLGVKFNNKGELVALPGREVLEGVDANTLTKINDKLNSLKNDPNALRALDIRDFVGNEIGKIKAKEGATQIQRLSTRLREALSKGTSGLSDDLASSNARFSELVSLRDEIYDAIGKDGKKAETWLRQILSGRNRLPKELAEKIKQETGKDLVEDAVFSRFAIEALGDKKQKTLFEQAFEKSGGVVDLLKDFVIGAARKTVANPERISKNIATPTGEVISNTASKAVQSASGALGGEIVDRNN